MFYFHVAPSARYRVDGRGRKRKFQGAHSQNLLLRNLHNWVHIHKPNNTRRPRLRAISRARARYVTNRQEEINLGWQFLERRRRRNKKFGFMGTEGGTEGRRDGQTRQIRRVERWNHGEKSGKTSYRKSILTVWNVRGERRGHSDQWIRRGLFRGRRKGLRQKQHESRDQRISFCTHTSSRHFLGEPPERVDDRITIAFFRHHRWCRRQSRGAIRGTLNRVKRGETKRRKRHQAGYSVQIKGYALLWGVRWEDGKGNNTEQRAPLAIKGKNRLWIGCLLLRDHPGRRGAEIGESDNMAMVSLTTT